MISIELSTNVVILISAIILLLIIATIVFIIFKDRKNDRNEIDDLLGDLLQAKPREPEVVVKQIDPTTNMEIKEEPVRQKIDLEAMLEQMQRDLDAKKENAIEKFEKEQEEKAIISYQELVDNLEKEKLNQQILKEADLFEKEQEEEAIISYSALKKPAIEPLELFKEQEDTTMNPVKAAIKKIESPRENKDKKFKNTEFISPIFGKMKEHLEYPTVKAFRKGEEFSLENYFKKEKSRVKKDYAYEIDADTKEDLLEKNINVGAMDDEVKKNDDFLNSLKEFRSNL